MKSSYRIDRAIHGPSMLEVIGGAVLSLLLGVVLAIAYLVTKPVIVARTLPKTPVADKVYYIEGSRDVARGQTWMRKRQAFLEGQSIELIEEELNTALSSPTERPREGTAGSAGTKAAPSDGAVFVPGPLVFRIAGGELQVGLPVRVPLAGMTIQVQASGGFSKAGGVFQFSPKTFYIGSYPLHRFPVLNGLILRRVFSGQAMPDDIAAAWKKVTSVAIEDRVLKLEL